MKKTKEPKTEIPPYEPDVIEKTFMLFTQQIGWNKQQKKLDS